MSNTDNGGAAFPSPGVVLNAGSYAEHQQGAYDGMTLRDYFAAKVLERTSDGVDVCDIPEAYDRFATHAYRMADAMIRARGAA